MLFRHHEHFLPDIHCHVVRRKAGRKLLPKYAESLKEFDCHSESMLVLRDSISCNEMIVSPREGYKGQDKACCRLRHRKHVQECIDALLGYQEVNEQLELASEELRYAAKALGKVTGAIGIEDILDAIFSEFCVGK